MKNKYVVQVKFWNIDMEYGWTNIYILSRIPNDKWLRSLYDGVNDPQEYTILGKLNE